MSEHKHNDTLDDFTPEFPPDEHDARFRALVKKVAKMPPKSQVQLHKELHESGKVVPKPRKPKGQQP